MLQIYDMGPMALLPLQRKACWGFFHTKNRMALARFEPANLGTNGQHATPRPPKPINPFFGYQELCPVVIIHIFDIIIIYPFIFFVCRCDMLDQNFAFFLSCVPLFIKLDWSVCICPTQLYDGRDMYRIYYIKNNYMLRHFTLAIFRLRNEET